MVTTIDVEVLELCSKTVARIPIIKPLIGLRNILLLERTLPRKIKISTRKEQDFHKCGQDAEESFQDMQALKAFTLAAYQILFVLLFLNVVYTSSRL